MADGISTTNANTRARATANGAIEGAGTRAVQSDADADARETVDLEGAAAERRRAGETFSRFTAGNTGPARSAPAPRADPSSSARTTRNTAQARSEALQKQMDASAARLAENSPTARALLERFRAEGGTFVDAGRGGYFTDARDGKPPVIGVPTQTVFGTQTGENERQQTIAHELGHFDYARNGAPGVIPPSYDNGGKTDQQIEARREANYVQQNARRLLADEAHATHVSAAIRDEVKAKTKKDIGVSGVLRGEKVPSKDELIDHYAALPPSGHPHQSYREYYSAPFREFYAKHLTPGGDGNL